jgi:hypothetical protein
VSDDGFKQKTSSGSEIGLEHLETPGNIQHLRKSGRIGVYIFHLILEFCAAVCRSF